MDRREVSVFIEVMRPVLTLVVCLVHVPLLQGYHGGDVGLFDTDTLLAPFLQDTFARSAVPLLTIFSGYLACLSLSRKRYGDYAWGRVRSLLVPFLLWNVLLALLLHVSHQRTGYPEMMAVTEHNGALENLGFVFGLSSFPVNYPLYFLKDLFLIALLLPPVLARMRPWLFLCAGAFLLVFCVHRSAVTVGDVLLIYRSDMLLFFLLGYGLARFDLIDRLPRFRPADDGFVVAVFFALCIVMTGLLVRYDPDLDVYTTRIKLPLSLLFLCAVPAIAALVRRHADSAFVTLARKLSSYSFTLFLVHGPVGFLVEYVVLKYRIPVGNARPMWEQALFVLAFLLLSCVVAWVVASLYRAGRRRFAPVWLWARGLGRASVTGRRPGA